jgi:hypothetical protein
MSDIETIIYTDSDERRRISVSSYDNGVFLHINGNGFTSYAVMNQDEAQQLIDGLLEILEAAK